MSRLKVWWAAWCASIRADQEFVYHKQQMREHQHGFRVAIHTMDLGPEVTRQILK